MIYVTLIGTLASYSEFSVYESGEAFCHAALSVKTERRNERGDVKPSQEWLRLLFYGENAERFSVGAQRGKQLWVDGKLQSHPKADRVLIRNSMEVVVEDFRFLEAENESESG